MALPVLGGIAAALGGAYLDARFGISTDLRQIQSERAWQNRLGRRIADLGETCTLYAMLERIDPELDALWFEGRTWSYGELKTGNFMPLNVWSLSCSQHRPPSLV